MSESIKHADEEIKWFKLRFGDRLTDEYYQIIRMELIAAYRKGYELGCNKGFLIRHNAGK